MSTTKRTILGPWQAVALFVLMWLGFVALGPMLRAAVLAGRDYPTNPHAILTFRMVTGLPLSWIALGGSYLLLRLSGLSLADSGWRRPARIWGWLGAAAVIGLYLISSFRGPWCHGLCFIDPHAWLSDWSPFRLSSALAIGITAGVCEEGMFRGFVMAAARAGRAPLIVQMILSGLLFGIAHAPVANLSGHFDAAAAVSVVLSTSVFGMIFAGIYAAGGRSLTPVMIAHGLFAFTTEPWMMLWGMAQTMHHGA